MCIALPELLASAKDIVLAIAAATTAVVAVLGLRRWRQELHGKAHFEVARSFARATYKLRNAIQVARSPLILGGEFPGGSAIAPNHKDPETEAKGYAHVFGVRWEPISAALQEFDAQTLEAEALWGISIRTKAESLRALVRRLRAAMEAFVFNAASGGEDFRVDRDFGKQVRSEVFETGKDNQFSADLVAAVGSLESELRPHLARV